MVRDRWCTLDASRRLQAWPGRPAGLQGHPRDGTCPGRSLGAPGRPARAWHARLQGGVQRRSPAATAAGGATTPRRVSPCALFAPAQRCRGSRRARLPLQAGPRLALGVGTLRQAGTRSATAKGGGVHPELLGTGVGPDGLQLRRGHRETPRLLPPRLRPCLEPPPRGTQRGYGAHRQSYEVRVVVADRWYCPPPTASPNGPVPGRLAVMLHFDPVRRVLAQKGRWPARLGGLPARPVVDVRP